VGRPRTRRACRSDADDPNRTEAEPKSRNAAATCRRAIVWDGIHKGPAAPTLIQNDSGLPQGPADLPLAGSTCGKPTAHRGPLAGMIDGGTAWEGKSCVWPETA
jgi:hypothetical protein